MKLNNRGQTLVLFVLLLPVLLLVLGFLADIGNLYLQKRKVDYTVTAALNYGIEHKDSLELEQEIHKLLILNLKTIEDSNVIINNHNITISVTKKVDRLFPFLYQEKESFITIQKQAKQE